MIFKKLELLVLAYFTSLRHWSQGRPEGGKNGAMVPGIQRVKLQNLHYIKML